MFNRIKERRNLYDEMDHLRRELDFVRRERVELQQANAGLMLDKRGAQRRIEGCEKEIAKLNAEIIEREKDALAATEKLKRREYENGLLRDQLERQTCPADCKHKNNRNACRPCSRYPFARDKYETEE